MQRYLQTIIKNDLSSKLTLLSGPRQCGKTTLSKSLFESYEYLSFDLSEDRERLDKKFWNRNVDGIIFDEIHKMKEWKRWLKGIYDTEGNKPHLVATGSARFDTFSKVGDSLAGRFLPYRLHPIDIKEACTFWENNPEEALSRILSCSGFPEPFLRGETNFYRRWQRSHLDIILRQDFLDLYSVRHIKSLEILVDMLIERVGSQTSFASLARDLQVDGKTMKSWIEMIENIYAVFKITPYHNNIARSLLKEPKIYFYDIARIKDPGAQIENLVAASLLKAIHFLEDTKGYRGELHYLKTKTGQEIDFCVCVDDKPILAVEVKLSDAHPSPAFKTFAQYLGSAKKIQLVKNLNRSFSTPEGVEVTNLAEFLSTFDLENYLL
jgi:predicted AAA+ superfamily ATPase